MSTNNWTKINISEIIIRDLILSTVVLTNGEQESHTILLCQAIYLCGSTNHYKMSTNNWITINISEIIIRDLTLSTVVQTNGKQDNHTSLVYQATYSCGPTYHGTVQRIILQKNHVWEYLRW